MRDSLLLEEKYVFEKFNSEIAYTLGKIAIDLAKKSGKEICLEIYGYNKVLFSYCFDGCTVNNLDFLRKKRNSVLYFGHSTKYLNIKNNDDSHVLESKYGLSLSEYCITAGGFPIRIKECGIVGAICVSGLKPDEDHSMVLDILQEYFGK